MTDGGSMYWVVGGFTLVRQRILNITEDQRSDGTPCTALLLHRTLVPVAARPTKPFQGWRYLPIEAAPPDLIDGPAAIGETELPPRLRRELRELCLL